MSLVVNIYYTGQNQSAKKFAQEMIASGIVEEVRKEKGNLKYEYFFPVDDPETVLLIDAWEDKQALDAHHKTQAMQKIAALREKYKLKMRVEQYIPLDKK